MIIILIRFFLQSSVINISFRLVILYFNSKQTHPCKNYVKTSNVLSSETRTRCRDVRLKMDLMGE